MSRLLNLATSLGLKVTESNISDMDGIIFGAKVVGSLPNITISGGKHYRLNTKTNTSEEVTAKSLSKAARKALDKGNDKDGSLAIAEDFGLVDSVTLVTNENAGDGACITDVLTTARDLGMKVTDVSVATQDAIIFKERGINELHNLTKSGSEYYILDTKKNTASLINPDAVAVQAVKDLKKGKETDYTCLAEDFRLITSISLAKTKDQLVRGPSLDLNIKLVRAVG